MYKHGTQQEVHLLCSIYIAGLLLSKVSGKYTKCCEWKITTEVDTVNLDSKMIRIRDVHNANPASVDGIQ